MSTIKGHKLQKMLSQWPGHAVLTSEYLHAQGINADLIIRYIKSGWLKRIGTGAYLRLDDKPSLLWAIYSVQNFTKTPIHIGGKTALEMQGKGHFGRAEYYEYDLFTCCKSTLPSWFKKAKIDLHPNIIVANFLPDKLYLTKKVIDSVEITLSSPERAALELLYASPKRYMYDEIKLIFENLSRSRASVFQELLEASKSVKVNRLCLFLGKALEHPWYEKIDHSKINLGSGVRSFEKSGVYDKTYNIFYPIAWKEEDYVI